MALREIIFRGKRLDKGEWVEGFFAEKKDPLLESDVRNAFILAQARGDFFVTWFPVDPSTVGQFTGLRDKNGECIFEGDVVRFTERRLGGKDVPVVEVVEFSEGGFATNRYFLNNWLRDSKKGNTQLQDIEVIGNRVDNSELLEVNEND